MKLRVKTALGIGTILMVMIAIILVSTRLILLDGFAVLERRSMMRSTEQALHLIDGELSQIATVIGDWAPWDDTYRFVQNHNQEYIDNNLGDSTLINLPIDFLVFADKEDRVVHCTYVDPETLEAADCPESLLSYVESSPVLFRRQVDGGLVKGIDILPEAPVFLAAGPILTSQFEGPVQGTLIAGRFLFEHEIKRLAEKINLSILLQRLDGGALPAQFAAARPFLSVDNRVKIIELDERTIGSFVLLTDLQDEPILMMGIDEERQVMEQGRKSLNYLVIALVTTGILCIIATLYVLERTVLSRIARLNDEVKEIGRSGDLNRKTSLRGRDEMATLSAEINRMIDSVRISTERDRAILETIEDGYFELDVSGCLRFYNDSLSRLFKRDKNEMIGASYRRFLERDSAIRAHNAFKELYETGQPIRNLETSFTLGSGEQKYLESTVTAIRDDSGTIIGFRGITRDVTEKKESAEQLVHMVYHDSLTGLLNRKALYEDLSRELSYADRYRQQRALLFIDLDDFKKVNDTYGHGAGDQLLCGFSQRLRRAVRSIDRTYRLGGDEFAVILSSPNSPSPEVVAQRIIDMMAEPFEVEGARIDFVTTSIGISIFPLNGQDAQEILHSADSRMYEAKKRKNAFFPHQT